VGVIQHLEDSYKCYTDPQDAEKHFAPMDDVIVSPTSGSNHPTIASKIPTSFM
jgi:hypothetical protein